MKNFTLAFIIVALFSRFALAEDTSIFKPIPREHRGFYNSMNVGIAYNWFTENSEEKEKRYRETENYDFAGFSTPFMEYKLGVAIANLVAFHTTFNFAAFTGSMDYDRKEYIIQCITDNICTETHDLDHSESYSEATAYNFRTFIGFGTTFYPFRNKESALNGLFFGGSVGYAFYLAYISDRPDNQGDNIIVNGGNAFSVELGKEWWVNSHLSLGVGLGFAHTSSISKNSGDKSDDKYDNVISISFRLTRG